MDVRPRDLMRALLVAAAIGIPVSLAALAFLGLTHEVATWIWKDAPAAIGFSGEDWWWVLLVPTVGGALAGLAVRRLPGNGGHEPLHGVSASPVQPSAIPGVLLAALASLPLGAVLGPEAPLVALGSALGLWFARAFRLSGQLAPLAGAAGLFASIAALFGNPLIAAFLVLEVVGFAGLTAPMAAIVLPGMLSAALGYLVFTGVGDWTGIQTTTFEALDLPDATTAQVGELLGAIVVGVLLALLIRAVREVAHRVYPLVHRRPAWGAPAAGLVVGATALLFAAATGQSPSLVLFSGETDTATVVENASAWGAGTVLLLIAFKAVAYAVSLGSLFRGGPVFPALLLGVATGALLADLFPGSETAAVVAGMAAATSAMLRLPLTAVLLAVFLGGSSAVGATSVALVASVTAYVVSIGLDRRRGDGGAAAPASGTETASDPGAPGTPSGTAASAATSPDVQQ
jgi:H+/Cl- antiporter ClcA